MQCVYENGPCAYELYRLRVSKRIDCVVAAPSLTPRKPGERIKTKSKASASEGERLMIGDSQVADRESRLRKENPRSPLTLAIHALRQR